MSVCSVLEFSRAMYILVILPLSRKGIETLSPDFHTCACVRCTFSSHSLHFDFFGPVLYPHATVSSSSYRLSPSSAYLR